ncbi:MAG: type II secretion system protein N [Pseudomonadota bacterium]|nr:type II secretion system protein N [Pseudomonadota bacterium]
MKFETDSLFWSAQQKLESFAQTLLCYMHSKRTSLLSLVVLSVLVAVMLVSSVFALMPYLPSLMLTSNPETTAYAFEAGDLKKAQAVSLESYDSLERAAWFGASTQMALNELPVETVKAETALNLTLKGTISGSSPYAIIVDNMTGESKLIQMGESVLKGVVLKDIQRRMVVLSNKGKLEKLSLPGNDFSQFVKNEGSAKKPATVKPSQKRSGPSNVYVSNREVVKRQEVRVSKADIKDAFSNLGRLATQARFLPRIEGEEIVGFRVTKLKHDSFLAKLTVQENDILVKVDDVPVSDRDRLFPMLMELKNADEAEIVLNRRGTQIGLLIKVDS